MKKYLLPPQFLFHIFGLLALLLVGCQPINAASPAAPGFISYYPNTAQHYLELAKTAPMGEKQAYQLRAAGRYLQDQQFYQAQTLLNQINDEHLSSPLKDEKNLLLANMAVMQNQGQSALGYLSKITMPSSLSPDQQRAFFQLLSIANLQTNNPLASAQARMQLDSLLTNSTAKHQNNEQIWTELNQLSNSSLASKIRHSSYGQSQGWYEIVYITKQYKSDPNLYNNEVSRWRQNYPQHPANELLAPGSKSFFNWPGKSASNGYNSGSVVGQRNQAGPTHVALLLPMSGKLGDSGQAIRSGFMAAYYGDKTNPKTPESIEVYNTSKGNIRNLYSQAINDGANLVIGPLTKGQVQELEKLGSLPVTTLALNYTPSNGQPPQNLYEFALSPQDEASQAAMKARKDGFSRALVIVPGDSWGQSIASVFNTTFASQGGRVVDTVTYTKKTNLDQAIKKALAVSQSSKRSSDLGSLLGKKVESTPQRRQDIDMIFLVATPQTARQINPLLRFYYAENLPVYATSQVYSGQIDKMRDKDLNGIRFCDMPWSLNSSSKIKQEKAQMYELVPNIRSQNERLYAFGYDAYTLSLNLKQNSTSSYAGIKGVTGTLYLGNNHQIFRQLQWTKFQNGAPQS